MINKKLLQLGSWEKMIQLEKKSGKGQKYLDSNKNISE